MARSGAWQASLSRDGAEFASGDQLVRLHFPGARFLQAPVPEGRQTGVSSYFLGNDPSKWIAAVPHYSRVRYRDVYPGIDLIYYGSADGKLEYDFEVAPAADPSRIRIAFDGVERIERAENGGLRLVTPSGRFLLQRKPAVFEEFGGERRAMAAAYEVAADRSVHVQLARRVHADSRIVVDPIIDYSTFIGGGAFDAARAVACDNMGSCYLAGEGRARNGLVGPLQTSGSGGQEVVVVKISSMTNAIVYYAVLGGDLDDTANAMVVDTTGSVYIAGTTRSLNFPTRSAAQPNSGGSLFGDAFAAKLSPDGASLVYSTYIGGTGAEEGRALAVDRTGAAYVVGSTTSRDSFPITPGAMQGGFRGSVLQQSTTGFITKIHPAGNRFVYSTVHGGSRQDDVRAIAVDDSGAAYVAGTTTSLDFPVRNAMQSLLASAVSGFLTKVNPDGTQPLFSTYYGGPAVNSIDAIALDASGNIVLAGSTSSPGYLTKSAAQPSFGGGRTDGIVAKIAASGTEVLWATYLGGSDADAVTAIVQHRDGSITCVGATNSQNFPQRSSPLAASGKSDGFAARLAPTGDVLISSMLLGGSEDDRALAVTVDGSDSAVIAGWTASADFPTRGPSIVQTTFGGGGGDMFLMRLAPDGLYLGANVSPLISSASILPFVSTVGNPKPPLPGLVQVTSAFPQSVAFTVEWSVIGSGNWLSAGPQRAETPALVTVFVNPATLTPGTYQGSVRLVPVNGGGVPTVVNVSFQIQNPAAEITSVSPSWLPAGAGDTEVTLRGRGFAQGASIRLTSENANGAQIVSPYNVTPSSMTFLAPRSLLFRDGSFELRVLNPDAEPSNPVSLLIGGRAIQVAPSTVVHAATGAPGAVAPGQMLLITGAGLGPGELTRADASSGSLPTRLMDVRVLFDGLAAPLVFVWDRQICAIVPYSVAVSPTVDLVVESRGNRSMSITLPVTPTQPGIFTADSWVYGYGTVQNESGADNGSGNPAHKGSVVTFVITGAGLPATPQLDGHINVPPLGGPASQVTVSIDGQDAEVVQVVDAPGSVSGLVQVRARVPQGARTGDVPLTVKAGDAVSPPVKVNVAE